MTKWHNYGVRVSDKTQLNTIIEVLEDAGLKVYAVNEDNGIIKAGVNAREAPDRSVKELLESHTQAITVLISVTANDTDDTASGIVYEVEDGDFVRLYSEHSGRPDSRHEWPGVSYNGLRVNGGKYY